MKTLKIISDILPIPSYSVIILCFFMPFLVIKCGTTELASVSGLDLAKGTNIEESIDNSDFAKELKSKSGDLTPAKAISEETTDKKESKPAVLLIIPFVFAVIGLIISFIRVKNKSVFQMILSGVGFVSMVIFGVTILNSAELKELNSDTKSAEIFAQQIISAKLGNAFYVACILFLVVLSFYAFEKYWKRISAEKTIQTIDTEIDMDTSDEYVK